MNTEEISAALEVLNKELAASAKYAAKLRIKQNSLRLELLWKLWHISPGTIVHRPGSQEKFKVHLVLPLGRGWENRKPHLKGFRWLERTGWAIRSEPLYTNWELLTNE